MKIKKILCLILTVITMLSVMSFNNTVYAGQNITYYKGLPIDTPLYIPASIPATSTSGNHPFNDKYWVDPNYHVIVYGTTVEVGSINDGPTYNSALGTWEYRYLGFDQAGNPFSNTRYPDDADLGPNASKPYEYHPWNKGLCMATDYSTSTACAADINRIWENPIYGFPQGYSFYGYGNVQSYPTLLAPGSFRMWHLYNGSYWYQTFEIPHKDTKLNTPFQVTTQILSSDFTIDENETTVDVSVKVTAKLEDEAYYSDPIKKVLYYTRDDIKKWDLKVEYKGTETLITLNFSNTNTATNTFNIKLSRSQLVDMENVVFNGVGRVTFHNDKYYRDSDPKTAQFRVIPNVQPLPPDLSITAPAKVNIKESYTVKVSPVVPQGESIKSVVLEGRLNGGAFQPITLSSYSATQQYNNIGLVEYRATVTLNNNKTATATATTNVVDERSSDATAKIEQPSTAYEGFWVTVKNKNTFTFEGTTYNALDASNLGIGSSDFKIQDYSQYSLDSSLYQTRNYNSNVSFDIRYLQPGRYKNTVDAYPKNGDPVSDTKGIQILRCPAIVASVDGTKKSNRKMTLDFSKTVVHPDYPLVSSKTYAIFEDTVTGEKVTCTNSSNPDSTNIKTNSLSGNKMDFLVKTAVDRIYKATIYVEDTRGNNDTQSITFTVVQDKVPIAVISTKTQELRKPTLSNKAEIFLEDGSYSEDGDYVTRSWEVAIDTNNNGLFTDEAYTAVNLLSGYQDLSGDGSQKKVRFLKTGVGKIDARIKSKEIFGQPTIDAFVTVADRKENTTTKTVDVINVAPVVDFKIFSNVETTINLVVGSISDTLQNAVQGLVASMQSTLISNKITPTINVIPQTLNTNRPVWNQDGGNSQNTGRSQFNGVLNSNIKWQFSTDVAISNNLCPDTNLLITPEGNILLQTINGTQIRLISKNGTLLNSIQLTYSCWKSAVLSDGKILLGKYYSQYPKYGVWSIEVYDKNLNYLNSINLPLEMVSNIVVDSNNCIHFIVSVYNAGTQRIDYYLYVLNQDLTVKTYRYLANRNKNGYGEGAGSIVVDNEGNTYTSIEYILYKFDINGNQIWTLSEQFQPKAFDETDKMLYGMESYSNARYMMKVDGTTGALLIKRNVWTTFENVSHMSIYGNDIYVSDYYRVRAVYKSNLTVDTTISQYGYVAGPSAEKAVISNDGQVFTYSREEDSCFLSQYGQPSKTMYNLNGNTGSSTVVLSSGVFSSDNTLYVAGAYVSSYNSHGQALCTGNLFLVAFGTGGTEQNTDNTLRKLRDYVPANSTKDFTVSITDAAFKDNNEANVANTANLLKTYNDNFFMIGNGSSLPDGQRVLNYGTGGNLYWLDSNMWNPLSAITNYIVSLIAPVSNHKVYEYYYKKGETVNYDTFYSDYELDPAKYGYWRYYHTPKTDGVIANNGVWLSSPITQFTQNGTYRVQYVAADSTGVPSYDRESNILEMTIYVEDGAIIPPPIIFTPVANIDLEGSTKKNRQLTLKLNYSNNNALPLNASTISWTLTPISGMTAADIKYASLTTQNIDTLYKKPGSVRATCVFRDTAGNQGTTSRDINISPDLAPTGTLQVTPITYRNGSGVASINVKSNVISPDDYIDSLKYYITYDADNNGSYSNDMPIYLPQYDNLRDFNLDINTKLGVMATTTNKSGVSIVNNVNPGTLQPVQAIRLDAGASVPVITSESLNLAQNTNYTLEFDYWSDTDNALFDVDLWPDDLPQIYPTAMKTLQHYKWSFSSASSNTLNSYLRFFNDRSIPNPSNIYITNINLYNTSSHNLIRAKSGVGNYMIQADVIEGFQEPTIPAYITSADYLTLFLQGVSKVDNISPSYDVRPEKGVYLVGEDIKFKAYDGSLLNGDASKGFFDTENDTMTGFNVKYTQNKAIMPSPDATSAYHNQTRTDFVNALDRAGEYTIDINAFDNPKNGDVRFDPFKKPSNTCSNKIIVHRRPVASLVFASSHATASNFNFGNNMYLDGTQLRIMDASSDPDGYSLTSSISYKADSGNYVQLSSGDTINLYYGSVFTIKVVTTDNWGADDTAIYTISVVPDLNMVPEVIPHTIKVGNNGTLKLTTNQYATSARAVVFGINHSLNLVSSTATEKVWQNTFNVPLNTPIAQYPAQFYATAEGMAEQRKDTHFHTTFNSPPTVDIIGINPSVVYEGDVVSVTFQPNDPDLDTLTCLIELFDSSNNRLYTHTLNINSNGSTYALVTQAISIDIALGNNYRVEVTVTDPYDEFEKDTYTFSVLPLSITGFVNHTDLWNEHRQSYNLSKTGNPEDPRTYDVFFPGERFIMDASTTDIDSSRPDLTATSVTCNIVSYSYSCNLTNTGANNWSGSIWDSSMESWSNRSLSFNFSVSYSNGTVKTYDATVDIIDDSYWRLHMLY